MKALILREVFSNIGLIIQEIESCLALLHCSDWSILLKAFQQKKLQARILIL